MHYMNSYLETQRICGVCEEGSIVTCDGCRGKEKPMKVSDGSQQYKIALMIGAIIMVGGIGYGILTTLQRIESYLSIIASQNV